MSFLNCISLFQKLPLDPTLHPALYFNFPKPICVSNINNPGKFLVDCCKHIKDNAVFEFLCLVILEDFNHSDFVLEVFFGLFLFH